MHKSDFAFPQDKRDDLYTTLRNAAKKRQIDWRKEQHEGADIESEQRHTIRQGLSSTLCERPGKMSSYEKSFY